MEEKVNPTHTLGKLVCEPADSPGLQKSRLPLQSHAVKTGLPGTCLKSVQLRTRGEYINEENPESSNLSYGYQ